PNTIIPAFSTGASASVVPPLEAAPYASRSDRSAQAARPTTSLKTLPADARTAFAPNGSAHPASTTSAGAPAAAAVRQMATSLSGLLISGWLEVVLGNLHQPGKGTAVAHGQVSQHLAVDLHPGLAKAVHQFVVGQPRLPRGGVDPRDPQLPHLALAAAAVAERVGERVKDRLVSGTEQELHGKPEGLGPVEDPTVAAMRRYAALDSCHLGLDPQRPADRFAVALEHRLLGVVLALVLLRLLVQAVAHPGVAANDLPVASHAHALSDSLAGLELRHWSLTPSARRPRPAGSAPGS